MFYVSSYLKMYTRATLQFILFGPLPKLPSSIILEFSDEFVIFFLLLGDFPEAETLVDWLSFSLSLSLFPPCSKKKILYSHSLLIEPILINLRYSEIACFHAKFRGLCGLTLAVFELQALYSKFAKSQKTEENREKMGDIGCEIICGAPTILAVKG